MQRIGEILGSAVIKGYTHLEKITNARLHAASVILDLPTQKYTCDELKEVRKRVTKPSR